MEEKVYHTFTVEVYKGVDSLTTETWYICASNFTEVFEWLVKQDMRPKQINELTWAKTAVL